MVGLLFPGQGAQFVGMGKDLAVEFPEARALFEQADSLLGFRLSRLCWEGPAEELTRTERCQPALYVCSMAAWAALQSTLHPSPFTLHPVAAAGLSLGEYTALTAAGAFSFADGLGLVRLRGQAMEEAARARPGTMASILGMDLEPLETICAAAGAQIASMNSPGQIVISGTVESVAAASAKARERGAKRVIELPVGGAFHSRLMEPAAARLQQALEQVEVRSPALPVLSNVTGARHTGPAEIRMLLVEQLTRPVQWIACMREMLAAGARTFLEAGPGSVLKGLARKIDPGAQVHSAGTAAEAREAVSAVIRGHNT